MFGLRFLSTIIAPDFFKVASLQDLEKVNRELESMGLPKWFLGFEGLKPKLNPNYKMYPTPRINTTWSGSRLNQLYLRPFAQKGEWAYETFKNKFYASVPEDQMPRVIDGPEIVIRF